MRITKKANKSRITSVLCTLSSVLCTLLSVLFIASCQQDDIVPDTPTEGKLVRLTFGTADAPGTRAVWKDETGKGNLIFNWDSDPLGQRMVAVISNGAHIYQPKQQIA